MPVSRLTRMLPGWGSAWKKPSIGSCLIRERRALRASSSRSRPAESMASTSLILTPVDELLRQDLRGGEVGEHGGDVYAGEQLEVLRQADGVVGLAPVVEFVEHAVAELFEHPHEVDRAHEVRPTGDDARGVLHDADVGLHLLVEVGTLDLDGHLGAVVQRRPVDLGRRGGGERAWVEGGEELLGWGAEFLDDAHANELARERGDVALQLLEFGRPIDRDHRGLARDDLPHLDVGGAQLLDHEAHLHRRAGSLVVGGQAPHPHLQTMADVSQDAPAAERKVPPVA